MLLHTSFLLHSDKYRIAIPQILENIRMKRSSLALVYWICLNCFLLKREEREKKLSRGRNSLRKRREEEKQRQLEGARTQRAWGAQDKESWWGWRKRKEERKWWWRALLYRYLVGMQHINCNKIVQMHAIRLVNETESHSTKTANIVC